ncbi:zinc finger protein 839 [Mauremys mutica]|uniref:zinc finger protein 839 n=1 Tax=Mauremys mutica TaxID=74926 RepID=UPI001D16114E|nr:zinc finger protein 839 [Mauremys mutica]
MAAPENGGGESAAVASPPPPAEEEPPGPAAARGARHSAAAGERVGLLGPGYPPGAVAARGDMLGPLEPEEGGGLLPPLEAGSPTGEGSEVLAVTEELAQSLAASSSAVGTTLYLEPGGSLVQGAELSAEEQLVVAATENQAVGLTGNLAAERSQAEPLAQPPGQQATATPLAPEELQRVIEQVSRAQKQPPPPLLPSSGAGIGSLQLPPPRAGGFSLPQEISFVSPASGFSRSPQGCSLTAASGSQPVTSIMHNAAQQLQNVAQQVALQQGKAIGTTRCLVHKQLEAICVQVQPGQMKENEKPVPPLAEVQSKAITPSQSVGRNSGLSRLNIINPQIIRIQPVTGTEQQQFFLHSSSEPPVQLLVQRPLAPDGPVSVNKIPTHQTLNGQKTTCATVSATESRNVTLVAASSANALISSLEKKQKEELKLKKSLKVKTRCGRISRPPKYKAKDYKFIKTEDLADGHQSDSDDYSELSIEEDDEGKAKGMDTLFNPLNYNLKPKMFKCQTCEKSYIGKGGLARHYKLNPGHGQLESSQQKVSMNKTNRSVFLDISGGADDETVSLTLSQPIAVTLNNENSLAIGSEESASSQSEQQTGKSAADRPLLAAQQNETDLVHWGPGRRRRPKRRGRPRMTGRSICSGRLNRPGQSPSKSLSNVSTEHIIFRRKAGLKELIQQCDNEDLMELALPRLTKLVTVYEFLLMKVEKGYPAKAFFPDVYREFEELHNMVKKMSQEHFSNSDFLSYQQPVEIKDPKVAESLGITEKLLGKQKIQAIDSSTQCVIKTVGEQMFTEISGKKRANESSYEELLPSAKRTRVEGILENVKDVYASQNGEEEEEKSWNLSTLTTKDGFNPLNGVIVLSEDRGITPCITGSAKHTGEQHKSLDLEARTNSANSDIFQSMRMECSQLISIQGPDSTSNTSPPCTEALLHAEADNSPEVFVQAHFVNENTAGRLTSSEFCNCIVSDDVIDNQSTHLSISEETDHNGKYQKLQQDEENQSYITSEQSEQLNDADIADQMQQLEKVFSTSIGPVDHSYKTQTDPHQNPVQETSMCTRENLESPVKNLNEFSCGLEEQHAGQHELENAVTVGETVAFEIANESHEFMSQGHEQIFIQTADGLILSHPGTAVLSQAEGIVIVTNADGTTMHIRTPEGVPLETVEALLAMETDGQSEDILLSQSEVEP